MLSSWGRLLALGEGKQSLELCDAEQWVGRGATCSLVLNDAGVSSRHAKFVRGAPPTVEDHSTNGLWRNGEKLGKDQARSLNHADEISFTAPNAPTALKFIFLSADGGATQVPAAGSASASASAAAPAAARGASDAPSAVSSSSVGDASESHVMCSICQDILYRAVALQPCLHSFCGACYTSWMARSTDCPQYTSESRACNLLAPRAEPADQQTVI